MLSCSMVLFSFLLLRFNNRLTKNLMLVFIFIVAQLQSYCQIKILFDATKAEAASNADWIIDADVRNLSISSNGVFTGGSGTESNAQKIPTPPQPAAGVTTPETYWSGGLSFWGLDCAFKGYIVESLPYNGKITYGDGTNPQDLSNYKAFMVCEPNIKFTEAEKTAMLNFIYNGGGLFMISDHDVSDRNNDGWDSPHIWNDFMQINSTGNSNPFGIIFDYTTFSETSTNEVINIIADTLLRPSAGTGWGTVTKVKWSAGTSATLTPTANPSVKAIIYQNTGAGNSKVMVATARYGAGKIVAIGDSSPFDDGTGDPNDILYTGYNVDVTPNHRNLIMNSTIWLVSQDKTIYTFSGNGNWEDANNWISNKIPPATLTAGNTIIIDPVITGQCILNNSQHIAFGASITIAAGKNLLINGALQIQ